MRRVVESKVFVLDNLLKATTDKLKKMWVRISLKGWVIKSGASRVSKDRLKMGLSNNRNEVVFFAEEETLLRVEMAHRISQVAKDVGIDVVIPKEGLVAYANGDGSSDATKRYCVVCEKINVLSAGETVRVIEAMNADLQKELARKISTIVQKAGLIGASFQNIRLTPENKIAFINTEPVGLMVTKNKDSSRGTSVEKCGRLGLYRFLQAVKSEASLGSFQEQVRLDYKKVSIPKLSRWKIALSVFSFGLIPLINIVVSLVDSILTKRLYNEIQSLEDAFDQRPMEEQKRIETEHEEKKTRLVKKLFSYIEGVPYKNVS